MRLRPLMPGLIPLFAIALLATLLVWLQDLAPDVIQRLPLSPILIGILLGMAMGRLAMEKPSWSPGIRLAAGPWLKFAVVLIGLRLSLSDLADTGLLALPLVAGVIIVALASAWLLGRALGVGPRLTALLAVGTAICGASAIGATAPALKARAEETTYAIACVAVFGLAATLFYPPLLHILLDDARIAGLVLGGAIHDTAQVMGAAGLYQQLWPTEGVVEAATVSKLMRNAAMVVVVPLVIALTLKGESEPGQRPKLPLFIVAFLAMVVIRSLGDALLPDAWIPAWETVLAWTAQLSLFLFTMAMAALGMGVRPSILAAMGWRPALLALLLAVAAGLAALAVGLLLVGWA